jgi:hypothetical protein
MAQLFVAHDTMGDTAVWFDANKYWHVTSILYAPQNVFIFELMTRKGYEICAFRFDTK